MNNQSSAEQVNAFLGEAKFDTKTGEIRIAGTDWILMNGATFRNLVQGSVNILGSGADVIWLEAGKHAGREFSEELTRLGMDPNELPTALENFFTVGGWGKIQVAADFTKKEASVTIENSATARGIKAEQPVCHSIRGFIAGVCDNIFQSTTRCTETHCIATGDTCCRFHVESISRRSIRNPK